MNSDKPKLCIECRHYRFVAEKDLCFRDPETHLVDGSKIGLICSDQRYFIPTGDRCGHGGKFFESIPTDA